MSTVFRANKKPMAVKNLGWLLRHWKEVRALGFNYCPNGMGDGELVAYLNDGGVYMTDFASLSVCWNWLDRPVFRGLEFKLRLNYSGAFSCFIIGNNEWKTINKLQYSEFGKRLGL